MDQDMDQDVGKCKCDCKPCELCAQKHPKDLVLEIIKDPIHGSIQLDPLLMKIIKTEAFNRLKYIRQLGGLFYVYPGATHTRFEHSIGVCHLAGEFARMLQRNQPGLKITDKDVLCVEIAGLCHDIGHGPFSHLFDGKVLNNLGYAEKTIKHEFLSVKILEHKVYEDLKKDFEDRELYGQQLEDICRMIDPPKDDPKGKCFNDRMFLYEIVANKLTGIDVDKWDYFIRDCHYMGLQCEFDWRRLMQLSHVERVAFPTTPKKKDEAEKEEEKNQGDVWRICYNKKEAHNILGMFRTRASLHEKAYRHKTVIALERRLSTALLSVKDMKLLYTGKEKISMKYMYECLQKEEPELDGYMALTDDIIYAIWNTNPADVEEAQKLHLEEGQESIRKLFARDLFHRISPKKVMECLNPKGTTDRGSEGTGQEESAGAGRDPTDQEKKTPKKKTLHTVLKAVAGNVAKEIESKQLTPVYRKSVYDSVKDYLQGPEFDSSNSLHDMLKQTCQEVQKEEGEPLDEKKIFNILLQIMPHALKHHTGLETFLEVVSLSYGSETSLKDGPLVDSCSKVLFFNSGDHSSPEPLRKEEISALFHPTSYAEKEVWIYYGIYLKTTDPEDHILQYLQENIGK